MEADQPDPARHWLTRSKVLDDDPRMHPLPIEEGVELELADLRADPGYRDEFDEVNPVVKLSQMRVATVELVLEEFAARIRRQVDDGQVTQAGLRLAELADVLRRDLNIASARGGLG